VDPLGQIIAGPDFAGESTLVADLDMEELARDKFDFDEAGHYSRPDVFRLHVDEESSMWQ
jgi:nitrilase